MGKVTSLQGKAVGKIGSMVYVINGGQMIAREYQPNVANPNTVSQTNQRASFKLLSQLAAAMAPVIAIPKDGLRSSRNLFIRKNSASVFSSDGVASITYENLQLTNGNAGLPAIVAGRLPDTGITIHLAERCDAAVTRVVYIVYKKTSEETLQYVQSIIIDSPGADGTFPGRLLYVEGDICLFAYGMKDLNSKASAKYNNYNVENGQDVARLVLTRNLSLSDYQFTQTRGTTLFAGEIGTVEVPDGYVRVFLTANGDGQVSGAGVYPIGTRVTLDAVPNSGQVFSAFTINGQSRGFASVTPIHINVESDLDLIANFYPDTGQTCTPSLSVQVAAPGSDVFRNATGDEGITVSLTPQSGTRTTKFKADSSAMAENFEFVGWWDDDQEMYISTPEVGSTDISYEFYPGTIGPLLVARWKEISS